MPKIQPGFLVILKGHDKAMRGFSLVELLVVISILAVLMSLLLPALSKAREQTQRTRCLSNLRQFGVASMNYSNAFRGDVPYAGWIPPNTEGRFLFDVDVRRELFLNYGLTNARLWWCPSGVARANPVVSTANFLNDRWFTDPAYGPAWGSNNRAQTNYGYFAGPRRGYTGALAQLYQMPYLLNFSDASAQSTRILWSDPLRDPGVNSGAFAGWRIPVNTHDNAGDASPDGGNQVMADGHGEWRPYRFGVNTQAWNAQTFLYFQ